MKNTLREESSWSSGDADTEHTGQWTTDFSPACPASPGGPTGLGLSAWHRPRKKTYPPPTCSTGKPQTCCKAAPPHTPCAGSDQGAKWSETPSPVAEPERTPQQQPAQSASSIRWGEPPEGGRPMGSAAWGREYQETRPTPPAKQPRITIGPAPYSFVELFCCCFSRPPPAQPEPSMAGGWRNRP